MECSRAATEGVTRPPDISDSHDPPLQDGGGGGYISQSVGPPVMDVVTGPVNPTPPDFFSFGVELREPPPLEAATAL